MEVMSDAATDDRDERLAVVFDQLMQNSRGGSAQKRLDDAVRQHPDLARDLRELFATAQIADDIALLQSSDLNHLTGGGSGSLRMSGSVAAGSAIGSRIGEYELREELGRGGMGVVYRAFQASLQRTVALKMIPNAAFAASQDLARLAS